MNSIIRRAMLSGLCAGLLLCLCACSADYSRAYERALSTFASGEYADAAEAFDRLGDYANAAAYAAYSHGLVFYEQGQYAEAEPCFAQSRDLLYGEERYQYCHAHALADEGRFAEAAEAFEAIGEFEDAPMRCQYCLGRAAEEEARYEDAMFAYENALTIDDAEDRLYNLRGQIYNRAIELKTRVTIKTPSTCLTSWATTSAAPTRRSNVRFTSRTPSTTRPTGWSKAATRRAPMTCFPPCPATATRRSARRISRPSWASNDDRRLIFHGQALFPLRRNGVEQDRQRHHGTP